MTQKCFLGNPTIISPTIISYYDNDGNSLSEQETIVVVVHIATTIHMMASVGVSNHQTTHSAPLTDRLLESATKTLQRKSRFLHKLNLVKNTAFRSICCDLQFLL